MDEQRFDALTKALVAAKPSRREALRRLAGGALATVFGGVSLEAASAKFGTEAFNETCVGQSNTLCKGATPGQCGRPNDGCICALPKDPDNGPQCVQQPDRVRCPSRRTDCRENRDCETGESCILVSDCPRCAGNSRGFCAKKCPR
jgi:hypothetical protein